LVSCMEPSFPQPFPAVETVRVTEDVLSAYAAPAGRSVPKEITELDKYCREFLALCTFVVLSTATNDGQPDVARRGGEPGIPMRRCPASRSRP